MAMCAVRCIRRSFARNRPEFKKLAREILRIRGGVQKRNAFERVQSRAGRGPIARPALRQNELRCHQMEPGGGIPPPLDSCNNKVLSPEAAYA